MDSKRAFLNSASTLVQGFFELLSYRVVGHTAIIAVLNVNAIDKEVYASSDLPVIKDFSKITPREFNTFVKIYEESSIILAYSWIEAFLDEVDEALLISDPSQLGDNVTIKLGKLLTVQSIELLFHDIIKKKIREKGQWSLLNRLKDLGEKYNFKFSSPEVDIEWLTDRRNGIIHERRSGFYKISKKKVYYEVDRQKPGKTGDDNKKAINIASLLIADLYTLSCKELKITKRISQHKQNLKFIESLKRGLAH